MLHISDDGFGGFLVFEEPDLLDDMKGELSMAAFVGICVTTLLMAVMVNPDSFRDALCYLLVGLFINMYFRGGASLPFFRPLALPFYTAFVLSSTYSLVTNAADSPTMGLLMLPLSAIFALAASLAVFGCFFGDNEPVAVTFVLGITAISWIEAEINNASFHSSTFLFYLMRVITLIAGLWALVIFVQWLVALFKGEVRLRAQPLNLVLVGVGLIPMFGIRVFGAAAASQTAQSILALLFFGSYIALAVISKQTVKRMFRNVSGTVDILLLPMIVCSIFYYAQGTYFHIRSEVIDAFAGFLRDFPLAYEFAHTFQMILDCFGALFGEIGYTVASLIARVFDGSVPRFMVPPFISFVLMAAALIPGVFFLPDYIEGSISARSQKKKRR